MFADARTSPTLQFSGTRAVPGEEPKISEDFGRAPTAHPCEHRGRLAAPTTARGKGGTSRPNHTLPERNAQARKAADGIIWVFGSSKGNEGNGYANMLAVDGRSVDRFV